MDRNRQWISDPEMKRYFDQLPAAIQENLMQSSAEFSNIGELRACVQELQGQ